MSIDECHGTGHKKLGCQLIADGKYEEAEPIFRILVECRLKVFGSINEETASGYQMLACVLEKRGKYQEALKNYNHALTSYNQVQEGHPEADFIYASIVRIYRMTKQFGQALETSKHLLEIRLKKLGNANPKTALSYHNVAISLYDQGKHKEALDILNKALKVQQDAGDDDVHGIAAIYTTMAKVLAEQGRFGKAMELLNHVLRHQVKVLGQDSPAVASTFRNIALVYERQSNTSEAWTACAEALQIHSKLMGDKDPDAAWRKQCQQGTASPEAVREETRKTLQIAQVLRKQMAMTMLSSQADAPAAATVVPRAAAVGNHTTNDAQKRKLAEDPSETETSNVAKRQKLAKTLPSTVALDEMEACNRTQEVTKLNPKPPISSQLPSEQSTAATTPSLETTTTTTITAPATETTTTATIASTASATSTGTVLAAAASSAVPTTSGIGNSCSSTDPSVTQTQELLEKLLQIEALEQKGLFNLTQEEINILHSKQDILNQLKPQDQSTVTKATSMPTNHYCNRTYPSFNQKRRSPKCPIQNQANKLNSSEQEVLHQLGSATHEATTASAESITTAEPQIQVHITPTDYYCQSRGNDCDPTHPAFQQKRKLVKRLRALEAFEKRGQHNMTRKQVIQWNHSKQHILNQLGAVPAPAISASVKPLLQDAATTTKPATVAVSEPITASTEKSTSMRIKICLKKKDQSITQENIITVPASELNPATVEARTPSRTPSLGNISDLIEPNVTKRQEMGLAMLSSIALAGHTATIAATEPTTANSETNQCRNRPDGGIGDER